MHGKWRNRLSSIFLKSPIVTRIRNVEKQSELLRNRVYYARHLLQNEKNLDYV